MPAKILVIENSHMMSEYLSGLFKKKIELIGFSSSKAVKEWLGKGNLPSLVIADLQLQELDGLEFTKFFRKSISKKIPLVILTNNRESNYTIACLQAGANDYILRPFRPKILSIKIESLLGHAPHI